jgi:hypothetical protein
MRSVSGIDVGARSALTRASAAADTRDAAAMSRSARFVASMRRMRKLRAHGRRGPTARECFVRGRGTRRGRSIPFEFEWPQFDLHPNLKEQIVTKTLSSWTLAVAAAVGVCALAGCNQRESANETAADVSEERQDARENVAEEQREAGQTAMEGAEDRAAAEYDVAVAQADGQRKIAKEKCETLASDAQEACKEQAEATYESAKAQAQATLDAAKRSGSAATETPPPPAAN